MSLAYVEAIAAQAGLNIKDCRWDDGVDLDVGSNKPIEGLPYIRNLYLVLQLKSTTRWRIFDNHVHYNLKAPNYEKLRDPFTHQPQFLILYTMPLDRIQWVEHGDGLSTFRDTAYYLSLKDMPALQPGRKGKARSTQLVRIPITQRLTAGALLDLYKVECERIAEARRRSC